MFFAPLHVDVKRGGAWRLTANTVQVVHETSCKICSIVSVASVGPVDWLLYMGWYFYYIIPSSSDQYTHYLAPTLHCCT